MNSTIDNHYYAFGQKSAALLGLLLTSDGQVTAFAYRRPPFNSSVDPLPDMMKLYRSDPLQLGQAGLVPFTLTLADDKVGLFAIEPLNWLHPYESNLAHFLGHFNPFGADEIPYQDFGGIARRKDIAPNRSFSGVFAYDPKAKDPARRAALSLIDVQSGGQAESATDISSFADPAGGLPGGLFVTIRVNADNYADGCATLEFTGGHTVNLPVGTGLKAVSKLTLNTNSNP